MKKFALMKMVNLGINKRLFISTILLLTIILNFVLAIHMRHNSSLPALSGLWSSVAENLYNYGVYSLGERDPGGNLIPTAIVPPLYIYTYFIIFLIAGITHKAFILMSILLILLNIGTVFLTYKIGKLFSYKVGCIAALIAMLDLNLIYLANNTAIPDAMLSFFMTFSYYYLLKFIKIDQSYKNIIYGSFFLCLALLTKPVAYLLWFPISVILASFMLKRKKRPIQIASQIGIFLLIQVLFIGGWSLRNYRATGNAAFNLTSGDVLASQVAFMNAYQKGIPFSEAKISFYSKRKGMSENEWNRHATATGIKMILDSPLDYGVVMLKAVPIFFMESLPPFFLYSGEQVNTVRKFQDGDSHLRILSELWSKRFYSYIFWLGYIKLHLFSTYLMSLCGVILLLKNKTDRFPSLLVLVIISYFLLVSVPATDFRYRYPIMPIFCFLSGYAWTFMKRTLTSESE